MKGIRTKLAAAVALAMGVTGYAAEWSYSEDFDVFDGVKISRAVADTTGYPYRWARLIVRCTGTRLESYVAFDYLNRRRGPVAIKFGAEPPEQHQARRSGNSLFLGVLLTENLTSAEIPFRIAEGVEVAIRLAFYERQVTLRFPPDRSGAALRVLRDCGGVKILQAEVREWERSAALRATWAADRKLPLPIFTTLARDAATDAAAARQRLAAARHLLATPEEQEAAEPKERLRAWRACRLAVAARAEPDWASCGPRPEA